MKEEELIKKLENVKLPRIELQSHQRRLRMALLAAGYLKRQRRATILDLAKSKMKRGIDIMIRGLVSRQPVWKPVLASALAIALIIGLTVGLPSLNGQSSEALAAEIAENSPQVKAALGDEEVQVVKVIKVVDDKGTVICQGELGIITAEVDLKTKVVTEVVPMPELTEEEKEEAINIARADPKVQELLDKGASIGKVSPMFSFGARVNEETGEIEEFEETLVRVEITLGETIWIAHVDLAEGRVVRLREVTPMLMESHSDPEGKWKIEYFEGEAKPQEK
ncbi:hypothetical protein ES706_04316 [subsurface metagenome]